jgi:ABC-type amino acid transport substrate-binding protein
VGDWISYEPYGMAMRKNDTDFRAVVNNALMEAIEGGEYFKLYEKWFGPKSDVPYPMSQAFKTFLLYQVVPK